MSKHLNAGPYSTVRYRIPVATFEEVVEAKQASFNDGVEVGKTAGRAEGEKETWRVLISLALFGSLVAIVLSNFSAILAS